MSVYEYGQLQSVTRRDAAHNQLSLVEYSYDAHGRQITTNLFDLMGRIWKTTLPDNTSVTNRYDVTGLLTNTAGSRTYPVAYTYDYAGRMKTMKTWTNYPSGNAATTTWNYNAYRGWLDNKRYADNLGPDYTYTPAGRLATRTWARNVTTTYSYNDAGDLSGVDYSDSTPDVAYDYDRRGRQISIAQSGSTAISRTYNDAGQLLTESYTGGPLNGLTVTSAFDDLLRRESLSLNSQPSTLNIAYGYDPNSGRLETVTSGDDSATYSYLANSPLVENITFKHDGTTRMTTTKSYDALNRLTAISSAPSVSSAVSFDYVYNPANQRTNATLADNSRWVYQYDKLGQVISGKKYWGDNTPVAGQQFEYAFDTIGNRRTNGFGGNEAGLSLRESRYAVNNLNQYTSRTVPGYVNVLGEATNTASVSVNTTMAYRKDRYFRAELSVDNAANPVWLGITNVAVMPVGGGNYVVSNVAGHVFVPKTPESFGYDADGNLTNDGRWVLTWDGENRLIQVESLTTGPTASKRKVTWEFDGQGRRVRQTSYDGSSGSYVVVEDLKFVSDGWRHIAELNASNNALVRSYVWGLDLSGTETGAGGVGGLLMLNSAANGIHFYAYDGNGNVVALVKATDGTVSANYEYEPFGSVLRATGPMADENAFGFSTKRTHRPTRLVLYEFRAYDPDEGRFFSRDLIEEEGGENLYTLNRNDSLDLIDALGLRPITVEFNAFIPGRLGQWLPEPIPGSSYEFETDNRGFGGGSARVFARITIESTKIGQLKGTKGEIGGNPSRRRKKGTQGPVEEKQAKRRGNAQVIYDVDPCTSVVATQASAAYAFYPRLSPNLAFRVLWFFKVIGPNQIEVTIGGGHVAFPNYEGLLDGKNVYSYDTPYSGPTIGNLNKPVHIEPRLKVVISAETPPWCCQDEK